MYCDIDTVYHKLISNLVFFCVDFQIEFLQSCQEQNKSRIDGPKKEKSTKEEIITKNESHVVSYSTASNFMQNDHTSTSVSNVRVIHQPIHVYLAYISFIYIYFNFNYRVWFSVFAMWYDIKQNWTFTSNFLTFIKRRAYLNTVFESPYIWNIQSI